LDVRDSYSEQDLGRNRSKKRKPEKEAGGGRKVGMKSYWGRPPSSFTSGARSMRWEEGGGNLGKKVKTRGGKR